MTSCSNKYVWSTEFIWSNEYVRSTNYIRFATEYQILGLVCQTNINYLPNAIEIMQEFRFSILVLFGKNFRNKVHRGLPIIMKYRKTISCYRMCLYLVVLVYDQQKVRILNYRFVNLILIWLVQIYLYKLR